MKNQKNGLTIAHRSRKAAIELMNEYRYLVPDNAPIPEDYYIPNSHIAVLGVSVKYRERAAKDKRPSKKDYYVSVQFLQLNSSDVPEVHEEELDYFLTYSCEVKFYYPQYFTKEFAKHVAKHFKKGMVINLSGDSNLQRLLKYKALSMEVINVKALPVDEAFTSYPLLRAQYLPPVSNGENDYTVVIEYRYNGVDEAKQVGLLPHLFAVHEDVASVLEEHFGQFYNC